MNSPQNKIFIFFGILELYKHVVKSRNARKQMFLCLRNPCENTFSKLPIFLYIKKNSKHVRVLAVCKTQENIFFKKNTSIAIKYKNHNKS